jgi:hypothetical protein
VDFFHLIGVEAINLQEKEEVIKATGDNLQHIIENFEEVYNQLKGTKFESQLLESTETTN